MIYLNNSATSYPKPSLVIEAVNSYLNKIPLNPYRSGDKNCSRDQMGSLSDIILLNYLM